MADSQINPIKDADLKNWAAKADVNSDGKITGKESSVWNQIEASYKNESNYTVVTDGGVKMGYEGTQELKEAMQLYLSDRYNTALKKEALERGVKAIMKFLGGTAIGTIPTYQECCVLFEKTCKHSGGGKNRVLIPRKMPNSQPVNIVSTPDPVSACASAAGTSTQTPTIPGSLD